MTKRARTSAVSVAAEVATVLSCSEEACPPVGRSIPPIGLPRGIVHILDVADHILAVLTGTRSREWSGLLASWSTFSGSVHSLVTRLAEGKMIVTVCLMQLILCVGLSM